jgi:hypothetical protein
VAFSVSSFFKKEKFFYKDEEKFVRRKLFDKIRRDRCQEIGVTLIEIPYDIDIDKLQQYIVARVANFDLSHKKNLDYQDLIFPHNSEIEKIRDLCYKKGGKLISSVYVNALSRLDVECKCGYKWMILPSNLKSGKWCPKCAIKQRVSKSRLTIESMQQLAQANNGECLSESYKNARSPLMWKCNNGHTWNAVPYSIKNGTWCPFCYLDSRKIK